MEDFLTIVHPISKNRISIFSSPGRNLLKSYLQTYKSGGSNDFVRGVVREENSHTGEFTGHDTGARDRAKSNCSLKNRK